MFIIFNAAAASQKQSHLAYKVRSLPAHRAACISVDDQVKSLLTLVFMALGMFIVTEAILKDRKTSPLSAALWLGILMSFVSVCLGILRSELRNRALLEKGRWALGRITSQLEVGRRSEISEITYSFTDASGQVCSGKGVDRTKSYFLDMPVIIFYGFSDPLQNVAACATIWKLRGKHGEVVDLD
jgi:hypothetical protein